MTKKAKYLSFNGAFLPADKPILMYNNRGFLYSDCFSIECRGTSSKVFFFDEYYDFITQEFQKRNMSKSVLLQKDIFKTDIELLLQKNRIYQGFSARISFFREPTEDEEESFTGQVFCIITVKPESEQYFKINEKGIFVDAIYDFMKLPESYRHQSLFFDPAVIGFLNSKSEKKYDNFIFNDPDTGIIHSVNSVVACFKDSYLIIQEDQNFGHFSVIVEKIMNCASDLGMSVINKSISISDIKEMDEAILINPVYGINWIVGLGETRFVNKKGRVMVSKLNKFAGQSA